MLRFLGGNDARKGPPTRSLSVTKTTSDGGTTTNAPTLEDINETAWQSSSANDAIKSGRSKHEKMSRRSSTDTPRQKEKDRTIHRSQSEHRDRDYLDPSSRREIRRSVNSDPPIDANGERKEKKKKKKQKDAPQEGGRDSLLANGIGDYGDSEHKISKDTSFQDVLKNLNGATSGPGLAHAHKNEKKSRNVTKGMPTLDENKQNETGSAKLDFSGFKSPNEPTNALQALLGNANFSSDCSVGTINTTTQCALSLGHLIEEMQVEFQKLKKQKNKAESYAEKLHTDYVRMQEGLERDFEKACHERDELKIAREKDAMSIDKLKDELKAAKAENAALKQSMQEVDDKYRTSEEENGRMKIALEALLVRSGAFKKDTKAKQEEDGGSRRGKNSAGNSLRSQSKSDSASLPSSPEVRQPRKQFECPKSADCVKTNLEGVPMPQKSMTLPFDVKEQNHSSRSLDINYLNNDRDEDDTVVSNATRDDGSMDSPRPR